MAKSNKVWTECNDKRFINPYNFVSLGDEVKRAEDASDEKITGKIKVSLIVKTPLSIPDTESVKKEKLSSAPDDEHSVYSFFRVDGKPVIPGSQIRGMVRNAYETLSNSCFSVNNNNNILSARHANAGKAGIIQFKNNEWHLYEAKSYKDKYNNTINPETEVRRTWYKLNGELNREGKLFRTDKKEVECVNLSDAIKDYEENIKIYEENGGAFKKYKSQITYGIRKDGRLYPVFYETVEHEGDVYVYLEPSQIGRFVFENKLNDLLGSHISCSKHKSRCLCKACSLFGMISDNQSYASRLRFSDASFVEFNSMGYSTLKELAGPKITSVEYYTKRPENSVYWTYDYKIISYKKIKSEDNKRNGKPMTETVPEREKCDIELRGRKFYLHNPNLKTDNYQTGDKTKRNSTMELCGEGSKFSFDLYFDKITENQLRELVWTLAIGENAENGNQMHKLGHGKPLGLGSVKLVVESIEKRYFSIDDMEYRIEEADVNEYFNDIPFDKDSAYFKEYMAITAFDGLSEVMKKKKADISYPVADDGRNSPNSKASHQWFIANRALGEGGTTTSWSARYALPKITSNNPTIPAMEKRDVMQFENERRNSNTAPTNSAFRTRRR